MAVDDQQGNRVLVLWNTINGKTPPEQLADFRKRSKFTLDCPIKDVDDKCYFHQPFIFSFDNEKELVEGSDDK